MNNRARTACLILLCLALAACVTPTGSSAVIQVTGSPTAAQASFLPPTPQLVRFPGLFIASFLYFAAAAWYFYDLWINPKRFFLKILKSMEKFRNNPFYVPPHPLISYLNVSNSFTLWLYRLFSLLLTFLIFMIMLLAIFGLPSWIELP
jgi:hypothetical protein